MINIKFNNSENVLQCNFRKINDNVVRLIGITNENTNGFKAYSIDGKLLGDYSQYVTVYKKGTNDVYYSNNGSVEPTKDIVVNVHWDDEGYEENRPKSLKVSLYVNGVEEKKVIKASENWTKTFTYKVSDSVYLFESSDVDNYKYEISNFDVTYIYEEPSPVPSVEERIEDLEGAVCELYEMLGEND